MNPPQEPQNLSDLVNIFLSLLWHTLQMLIGIAVLVFIWGIVKFINGLREDTKAVDEGKNLMKWGLVALFILFSFMGIISFVYTDLGFARPFGFPFLPT